MRRPSPAGSAIAFALLLVVVVVSQPSVPTTAQSPGPSISRPAYFGEMAYNPSNQLIYASNDGNASVVVFAPATGAVVANIPMTGSPWGIAFSSTLGEAFVANAASVTISVVDYSTNAVIGSIHTRNATAGLAYDPQNGLLYAATYDDRTVQVFDPKSGNIVGVVPLPGVPQEIVYDPGNNRIYAALYALCYPFSYTPQGGLVCGAPPANSVAVIDPSTNTLQGTISVGNYVLGLAYDSADSYILALGLGPGNLAVIRDSDNAMVANMSLGASSNPTYIAWDSANGLAYVSLSAVNEICVVDLHSLSVKGTIPTAPGPKGLSYDPATGKVYVGSYDGFVQAVDPVSSKVIGAMGASIIGVGYRVFGNAGYSAPTFTYTLNGVKGSDPVPPSGLSLYADSGSSWGIQQELNGSNAGERWATGNTTSGTVGGPITLNFTYFEQVKFTFSYSALGGSLPRAPSIRSTEYGKAGDVPANASSWVDYRAGYQYQLDVLPTAPSSGERWMLSGNGSGRALSAGQVEETYYHQFSLSLSYSSKGVGFVPAPTVAYTYLGKAVNVTLPNSFVSFGPSSYWADAGKGWAVANPLPAGTPDKRWYAPNAASGTLAHEVSLNLTYQEQYALVVTSSPSQGGTVSPSGGWFAAGSTVVLKATPASGWEFTGWGGSVLGTLTNQTSESVDMIGPAQVVAGFQVVGAASTTTTPSGGGIQELPYQLLPAAALAVILVIAYVMLRRRPGDKAERNEMPEASALYCRVTKSWVRPKKR